MAKTKKQNEIEAALAAEGLNEIELVAQRNRIDEAVRVKIQQKFAHVPWDQYVNTVLARMIGARIDEHLEKSFGPGSPAFRSAMDAVGKLAAEYIAQHFDVTVTVTKKKP